MFAQACSSQGTRSSCTGQTTAKLSSNVNPAGRVFRYRTVAVTLSRTEQFLRLPSNALIHIICAPVPNACLSAQLDPHRKGQNPGSNGFEPSRQTAAWAPISSSQLGAAALAAFGRTLLEHTFRDIELPGLTPGLLTVDCP